MSGCPGPLISAIENQQASASFGDGRENLRREKPFSTSHNVSPSQ